MPKGHKRALGLGAEWFELEKSLSTAVRKYRALADRLVREPVDEGVKTELKGFLERNSSDRKKAAEPDKNVAPPILSDRERLLDRCLGELSPGPPAEGPPGSRQHDALQVVTTLASQGHS